MDYKKAVFGTLLAVFAFFAFNVDAAVRKYQAFLQGSEEIPPVITDTTGRFDLILPQNGGNAQYILQLHNAEDVTAAHLHCGLFGQNGPVVAPLNFNFPEAGMLQFSLSNRDIKPAAKTECNTPIANLEDLSSALDRGEVYVNAHSSGNPEGEARGQASLVSVNESMPQGRPYGLPDPYINLSEYYRLPGENFSVRGFGFTPGEKVEITAFGIKQEASAREGGEFTVNLQVPFSAIGSNQAVLAKGEKSLGPRSAQLSVGNFYPFVEPSSYYVNPGSPVSFRGVRFAPGEQVTVYFEDRPIEARVSDSSGSVVFENLAAPPQPGEKTFKFTGSLSGASAAVKITVAAWPR